MKKVISPKRIRYSFLFIILLILSMLLYACMGDTATSVAPAYPSSCNPSVTAATYSKTVDPLALPSFQGKFTYGSGSGSQSYSYTMLGPDPAIGGTAVISVLLVPVTFVFQQAGKSPVDIEPPTMEMVLKSPVFTPTSFGNQLGCTQFADAMRRAEFWQTLPTDKNYHLFLAASGDQSHSLTLNVRSDQGRVEDGVGILLYDADTLRKEVNRAMKSLSLPKNTLAMLIGGDVVMNNAVMTYTFGFHSESDANQPYLFANWLTPAGSLRISIQAAQYTPPDSGVLSHEVMEVMDDPLFQNKTSAWKTKADDGTRMEVGDPLAGHDYVTKEGYSLQDLAFFGWFAGQSIGINGRYDYLGRLPCPLVDAC